ncbi:MAG: hypothetical protein VYE40_11460 [Myxococcota bacterium]|jgi:hypothetical protein|nr:hypothetical protein [Myxococcota bacterium]
MKRLIFLLLLPFTTGCAACGPTEFTELADVEAEQQGSTACTSDEDCVATTYGCADISRNDKPTVTCAHTQDQPLYPQDACPDPVTISEDLAAKCACRQGTCDWP